MVSNPSTLARARSMETRRRHDVSGSIGFLAQHRLCAYAV
jgi:hypothetical protein